MQINGYYSFEGTIKHLLVGELLGAWVETNMYGQHSNVLLRVLYYSTNTRTLVSLRVNLVFSGLGD
jgi:hypothetical protein